MTLSIERRAELWGDRTAIVDVAETRLDAPSETVDERRVSYAELSARSERLAAGLAATGIGADDAVAVLSRNRIDAIALAFACRRLGATFAPISHRLTPATVSRPLERIEPTIVVHEPAQRDLVRVLAPTDTATFADLADAGTDPPPETPPADDDPLWYVHGDGGAPVVAFSREAVERNCVAATATFGFGRRDSAPLLLPLSSPDGLLRAAFPLLYVGGTLLLDRAFDPGDALEATRRADATVLVGRETEYRELAGRDGFEEALSSVSCSICETPVDERVRNVLLERGVSLVGARGYLACPTALVTVGDAADAAESGYRPVLDCSARLVDDGVLEGAGEGRLQLSGPLLADGSVDRVESGDGDDSEREVEADDGGRFVNGWFDTGTRVRRDDRGVYYPI